MLLDPSDISDPAKEAVSKILSPVEGSNFHRIGIALLGGCGDAGRPSCVVS